jgi:exonuclease III
MSPPSGFSHHRMSSKRWLRRVLKKRNIKLKSRRCVVNAVIRSVGDNVKAGLNNLPKNPPVSRKERRVYRGSHPPQPGSPLRGVAAPGDVQAKGSKKARQRRMLDDLPSPFKPPPHTPSPKKPQPKQRPHKGNNQPKPKAKSKSTLSRNKCLNIMTYNVRTMKVLKPGKKMKSGNSRPEDKKCFLFDLMYDKKIDIACLQETRLSTPEDAKFVTNEFVFYNSTNDEAKGTNGVGIVLRKSIIQSIDKVHYFNDRMIIVTGNFKGAKLAIVSTYSPTNGYTNAKKDVYYQVLEDAIQGLVGYDHSIVIGGDFNARIGDNDDGIFDHCCGKFSMKGKLNDNGSRMLDLCSDIDLVVADTYVRPSVRRREGTWYHLPTKKWFTIDHFLISKRLRSQIKSCEVDSELKLWTDHNAVVLTLKLKRYFKFPKKDMLPLKPVKKKSTDFSIMRIDGGVKLLEMGKRFDYLMLESLRTFCPLDYDLLLNTITYCTDGAPKKLPSRLTDTFYDANRKDLIDSSTKKRAAYNKWNLSENAVDLEEWNLLKRKFQSKVRRLHNSFIEDKLDRLNDQSREHHSKSFFKEINHHIGAANVKSTGNQLKKPDGKLTQSDAERKEVKFNYANTLLNNNVVVSPNLPDYLFDARPVLSFLDRPFEAWEYAEAVQAMQSGKSNGKDGLYIEFFKLIHSDLLEDFVVQMVNDNLTSGTTPNGMRDAIIVFLLKKGDNTECTNHRTLSLLSVLGKIQGRMILIRLISVAEKYGWFGETQQAFRKARGGNDAVLIANLVDSMVMEKNQAGYKLFVDNSKAYDVVSRDVLWTILERRGCPPLLLNLIKSTLVGARGFVKDNGDISEDCFDLVAGLKQGCVLSCVLFNIFMGAIMEEIRRRLKALGIGVKVKYNLESNPFVRTKSKKDSANTSETIINDILFADDSVFFGYADAVQMNKVAEVVNECMAAFGQKVNIKKTEFMVVERPVMRRITDPQDADDVDAQAAAVAAVAARKATVVKIGDATLNCVDHFKYIGSLTTCNGTIDKEIKTRIGKMKFAYWTHRDNIFQHRKLDVVKKLHLFRVFVVPAGLYNCSSWACSDKLLMTLNSTARSKLMKIFGFRWYHHTSYDFLIKLCRLLGVDMYPLHLIVKLYRLTFFGHIVRMDGSRLLKQLIFGEHAEGSRPVGRPRITWIDCIKKDLVDFGICVEGDLKTDDGWLTLKTKIESRSVWRTSVKTIGIAYALHNWYQANTVRRANRMIRENQEIIQCYEPDYDERYEKPKYDKLTRTPLEIMPNGAIRKILRDLGVDATLKVMNDVERVEAKESRPMNEYDVWSPPYISSRVEELASAKALSLSKIKRDDMVQKWLPTSNHFNYDFDADEEFYIEKFDGYRVRVTGAGAMNHPNQYHIVWKPRTLPADKDYPVQLPEVIGLPWDLYDEDWVKASDYERIYRNDPIFKSQMLFWKNGGVVGGGEEDGDEV